MKDRKRNYKTYFREEQKFRQLWLMIIIMATSVLPWIGLIYQIIFGHKFGNNPAPDWMIIIIWVLFGIAFPLVFFNTKLITEVGQTGIYLKFFPFHRKFKFFPFDEIESFKEREYRPIREYGGWGIRYGFGGMAYNVYGNKGIQLVMKNKKKILIGSQKSYEFFKSIQRLKSERV